LLRDDRNVSDYDHAATPADLTFPIQDAVSLVGDFIQEAKGYLAGRGLRIR